MRWCQRGGGNDGGAHAEARGAHALAGYLQRDELRKRDRCVEIVDGNGAEGTEAAIDATNEKVQPLLKLPMQGDVEARGHRYLNEDHL